MINEYLDYLDDTSIVNRTYLYSNVNNDLQKFFTYLELLYQSRKEDFIGQDNINLTKYSKLKFLTEYVLSTDKKEFDQLVTEYKLVDEFFTHIIDTPAFQSSEDHIKIRNFLVDIYTSLRYMITQARRGVDPYTLSDSNLNELILSFGYPHTKEIFSSISNSKVVFLHNLINYYQSKGSAIQFRDIISYYNLSSKNIVLYEWWLKKDINGFVFEGKQLWKSSDSNFEYNVEKLTLPYLSFIKDDPHWYYDKYDIKIEDLYEKNLITLPSITPYVSFASVMDELSVLRDLSIILKKAQKQYTYFCKNLLNYVDSVVSFDELEPYDIISIYNDKYLVKCLDDTVVELPYDLIYEPYLRRNNVDSNKLNSLERNISLLFDDITVSYLEAFYLLMYVKDLICEGIQYKDSVTYEELISQVIKNSFNLNVGDVYAIKEYDSDNQEKIVRYLMYYGNSIWLDVNTYDEPFENLTVKTRKVIHAKVFDLTNRKPLDEVYSNNSTSFLMYNGYYSPFLYVDSSNNSLIGKAGNFKYYKRNNLTFNQFDYTNLIREYNDTQNLKIDNIDELLSIKYRDSKYKYLFDSDDLTIFSSIQEVSDMFKREKQKSKIKRFANTYYTPVEVDNNLLILTDCAGAFNATLESDGSYTVSTPELWWPPEITYDFTFNVCEWKLKLDEPIEFDNKTLSEQKYSNALKFNFTVDYAHSTKGYFSLAISFGYYKQPDDNTITYTNPSEHIIFKVDEDTQFSTIVDDTHGTLYYFDNVIRSIDFSEVEKFFKKESLIGCITNIRLVLLYDYKDTTSNDSTVCFRGSIKNISCKISKPTGQYEYIDNFRDSWNVRNILDNTKTIYSKGPVFAVNRDSNDSKKTYVNTEDKYILFNNNYYDRGDNKTYECVDVIPNDNVVISKIDNSVVAYNIEKENNINLAMNNNYVHDLVELSFTVERLTYLNNVDIDVFGYYSDCSGVIDKTPYCLFLRLLSDGTEAVDKLVLVNNKGPRRTIEPLCLFHLKIDREGTYRVYVNRNYLHVLRFKCNTYDIIKIDNIKISSLPDSYINRDELFFTKNSSGYFNFLKVLNPNLTTLLKTELNRIESYESNANVYLQDLYESLMFSFFSKIDTLNFNFSNLQILSITQSTFKKYKIIEKVFEFFKPIRVRVKDPMKISIIYDRVNDSLATLDYPSKLDKSLFVDSVIRTNYIDGLIDKLYCREIDSLYEVTDRLVYLVSNYEKTLVDYMKLRDYMKITSVDTTTSLREYYYIDGF